MILKEIKPISMAEVAELAKDLEEKKALHDYLKRFSKLSRVDAEKISREIKALNNSKVKESDIIKVIDFLPKDAEELNKIFNEVSLTEEESNAILEIVRKY